MSSMMDASPRIVATNTVPQSDLQRPLPAPVRAMVPAYTPSREEWERVFPGRPFPRAFTRVPQLPDMFGGLPPPTEDECLDDEEIEGIPVMPWRQAAAKQQEAWRLKDRQAVSTDADTDVEVCVLHICNTASLQTRPSLFCVSVSFCPALTPRVGLCSAPGRRDSRR